MPFISIVRGVGCAQGWDHYFSAALSKGKSILMKVLLHYKVQILNSWWFSLRVNENNSGIVTMLQIS